MRTEAVGSGDPDQDRVWLGDALALQGGDSLAVVTLIAL